MCACVCVLFLIALLGIWFWQVTDATAPTLPPPLDAHAHLTIFNFPLKFVRIFWIFKSCATESNRHLCAEIHDYGHTDRIDHQHFNISRDFRWHIVNRSNRTNRSQHIFEMRQKESGELYSSNEEVAAAAAAPILCTCESKQLIAKRQRMTETAQKIEYSIQILYVCVHNIYSIVHTNPHTLHILCIHIYQNVHNTILVGAACAPSVRTCSVWQSVYINKIAHIFLTFF